MKYIQNIIREYKSSIAGMKANPEKWTDVTIQISEMEQYVAELEEQLKKVDQAGITFRTERANSRNLVKKLRGKKKKVDAITYGLYLDEPVKLKEYGLKLRKKGSSRPVPAKVMIISIVDDLDGEGFIINWQRLAGVHQYEVQKGVVSDSTEIGVIPTYFILLSTSRISVTDNDIKKGFRYFYRVRGVNASGSGEWSEAVNKVQ